MAIHESPLPENIPWAVIQVALGLGLVFVGSVLFSRIPTIGVGAHGFWGRRSPFFRRVEIGWDELTVQPILRFAGLRIVRLRSSMAKKALWVVLPLRDMAGFRSLVEQYAPGNEEAAKLVGGNAGQA